MTASSTSASEKTVRQLWTTHQIYKQHRSVQPYLWKNLTLPWWSCIYKRPKNSALRTCICSSALCALAHILAHDMHTVCALFWWKPDLGALSAAGYHVHSMLPSPECRRACRVWPWLGVTSCAVGCGRRPHFKHPTIGALDAQAWSSYQFVIGLKTLSFPLAAQRCPGPFNLTHYIVLLIRFGTPFNCNPANYIK